MSLTEADLDQQGVSKATGDARDRGYVMLEGRQITDVKASIIRLVAVRV